MKGLIVKDLRLFLDQKVLIFIGLVCAFLCIFTLKDPSFIIGYLTIMASCMGAVTVAYDEMNNGRAYIFTLPYSREKYAVSKYVFAFGLGMVTLAATTVIGLVLNVIMKYDSIQNFLLGAAGFLIPVFLAPAVMIPISLKFGHARSRIVLFIVMGFVIAIVTGLSFFDGVAVSVVEEEEVVQLDLFNRFSQSLNYLQIMTAGIIGSAVAFAASLALSIGIVKKMQF
ncbi:MAG: ABC-2 transporter permease [Lachnospiraceae bacterium]|nr:ABC-2 transporter permease [Lachnospiraceae bacterium]